MSTCKTCKHWKPTEDDGYPFAGPSVLHPVTYEKIPAPFDVRFCTSPDLFFYERPLKTTQATIADGSEYKAVLATGPDFGCVNHEPEGERS